MILFIFCNSCLNTCRNEEILLFQTQFFTCVVVIVRVENFYDISCQIFLFYGFLIITFIERIQLEVVDCFCIPYTQCIYYIVIVTNDRNIKRDRTYRLISFLDKFVAFCCFIVFYTDIAAKFYFFCIFRTTQLKWITVFQPVIRHFYLITVFDFLFEHTIAVTDTAAVCCITKCCQRVKEACSQTAKTAVSKCCIRFLVFDHVQVKAQLFQSFFYFFVLCQVDHVISKGTSHQELHGHIINHFRVFFFVNFLGFHPVVNDRILDCIGYCLKYLLFCCVNQCLTVQCFQVAFHTLNKYFFVKSFAHSKSSLFLCLFNTHAYTFTVNFRIRQPCQEQSHLQGLHP